MDHDPKAGPGPQALAGMQGAEPLAPGLYRHFKGNLYRLLWVARHSETLEPMVVYQALYGDRGYWVRPAAMWTQRVEYQGRLAPRFAWVGEAEEGPSS